jgi:hypothetical protein
MLRIYAPRVVADHLMMQDDFVRLHKFLVEMGTSRVFQTISES